MGEAANKAITFGVGIFVTMIIISAVIGIFSQMQEIYRQVDSTDTNVTTKFGRYAMYDNTTVTFSKQGRPKTLSKTVEFPMLCGKFQ